MVLLGLLILPAAAQAQSSSPAGSVELAWDLIWAPDIAGYRLHYGLQGGSYTDTLDVGNKIRAELTDLSIGATYACVVTAYNTLGMESPYSNEITFTVSVPPETDTDRDGLSDWFEASYGVEGELDPFADLNSDGLTVLAEFVHGLDPTKPHDRPLITSETIQVGEDLYLCVRYLVDPLALNFVDIQTERSIDLTGPLGWEQEHTVQVSSNPSEDYPGLIEISHRSLSPVTAQTREYLRLHYEALLAP